jgi:hypothetical protein
MWNYTSSLPYVLMACWVGTKETLPSLYLTDFSNVDTLCFLEGRNGLLKCYLNELRLMKVLKLLESFHDFRRICQSSVSMLIVAA